MKTKDYYINLHWNYRFVWDESDKVYAVSIVELQDCLSHGESIEEAVKNIKEALLQHIEVMIEEGIPINEPAKPEDYKGNIAYRTKPSRHYKIALGAKSAGKSISKYLDEILDKVN